MKFKRNEIWMQNALPGMSKWRKKNIVEENNSDVKFYT